MDIIPEVMDNISEASMDIANYQFAALCITEDGIEGVNALLDKREPEWKIK